MGNGRHLVARHGAFSFRGQLGKLQRDLELGRRRQRAHQFTGTEHHRALLLASGSLGSAGQLTQRRHIDRTLRPSVPDGNRQERVAIRHVCLDRLGHRPPELLDPGQFETGSDQHEAALPDVVEVADALAEQAHRRRDPPMEQHLRIDGQPQPAGVGEGGDAQRDDAYPLLGVGRRGRQTNLQSTDSGQSRDRVDHRHVGLAGGLLATDARLERLQQRVDALLVGVADLLFGVALAQRAQCGDVAFGDGHSPATAKRFDSEHLAAGMNKNDDGQLCLAGQRGVLADAMTDQSCGHDCIRSRVRIIDHRDAGSLDGGDLWGTRCGDPDAQARRRSCGRRSLIDSNGAGLDRRIERVAAFDRGTVGGGDGHAGTNTGSATHSLARMCDTIVNSSMRS